MTIDFLGRLEQKVQPMSEHHRNENQSEDWTYRPAGKLEGRTAIITGGDSGIGRATCLYYVREGADVAIVYLDRDNPDAQDTKRQVEAAGRRCLTFPGNVGDESFCKKVVEETVKTFGKLDILINNAAEQQPRDNIKDVPTKQLESTFRTNF